VVESFDIIEECFACKHPEYIEPKRIYPNDENSKFTIILF
jgi:hypothetical protein